MTNIFVIRHAEKPSNELQGVNEQGTNDEKSLIPRGWQRAGALATFFGSPKGLTPPARIYTSDPEKEKVAPHDKIGSNSKRPLETVTPLAAKLNVVPVVTYAKGDEAALIAEVANFNDTTLICWQHEAIPQIASLIMGSADGIPTPWPSDRFDVVWSFTREDTTEPWIFSQICQQLLAGDGPQAIS